MKRYVVLALLAGVVLGTLGTLAVGAWRVDAVEHTWCLRCARHRTSFGDVVDEHGGPVSALLATRNPPHHHVWADTGRGPRRALPLTVDAAREALANLDAIESDARAVAVLDEAFRNSPERAERLVRAVLDPEAHLDRSALTLVARPELSWPDRWRVVDAFLAAYTCTRAAQAVTCTLPVGDVRIVAWHHVPGSVMRGPVPWATWLPQGFAPTASPTPTPSLTPMTPIAPPIPVGPATPVTPAVPASPRDDEASVNAGIAQARRGDLEGAARTWSRLSTHTPRPAGLPRLRAAIERQAGDAIDTMILDGRCAAAQRLVRSLRTAGLHLDGAQHFGSACQQP